MAAKKSVGTKAKTLKGDTAFAEGVKTLGTLLTQVAATAKKMGLRPLTAEERTHADGRLHVGEPEAMTCLFNAIDENPQTFAPLADQPTASDDGEVTTAPARAALARATSLQPLAATLASLQQLVSDDVLGSAQTAKQVSVPAYGIAKAGAATSAKLRAAVAPAITFYSAPAHLRALNTLKKKNAAERAAKKTAAEAPKS